MDAQTEQDLNHLDRWRKLRDESQRELVMAVRGAVKRGATLREVAEVLECSPQTVKNMLDAPKELPQGWLRQLVTGEEDGRQVGD